MQIIYSQNESRDLPIIADGYESLLLGQDMRLADIRVEAIDAIDQHRLALPRVIRRRRVAYRCGHSCALGSRARVTPKNFYQKYLSSEMKERDRKPQPN